jgi:Ca2+-transporting ATPase
MVYTQLFFSLACRSWRRTMPELGFFTNPRLLGAIVASALLQAGLVSLPFARRVFATAPHDARDWEIVLALSLAPVTVVEVGKIVAARFRR